jgi:hypothetical protein
MTDVREIAIAEGDVRHPEIIHEGVYRLYKKPDGTLRIQYRRKDKDDDDFFEVPGEMVTLAQAAAEGNMSPAQMINATMKLMAKMK